MQGHTHETTPCTYAPARYEAAEQYNEGTRLKLSRPYRTANPGDQPAIGVKIAWNDLRRPWKPFVVLTCGRSGIQFGWLWAAAKENET